MGGIRKAAKIIARPLVPVLVDAYALVNKVVFSRKPEVTIPFAEGGPQPKVDRERAVRSFLNLTAVDGMSGQEGEIALRLTEELKELGFSVKADKTGNLVGKLPGTLKDAPALLFSAHMDTIEHTDPASVRVGYGEIYTDEKHILGADDRSGIAAILEGLRGARDGGVPHGDITVVFTREEETGLKGSLRLDQKELGEKPTLGFVLDSLDVRNVHTTAPGSFMLPGSVTYRHDPGDPLVQLPAKSLRDAGVDARLVKSAVFPGAGSDANAKALNSGPVRSITVGTGMRDPHSDYEHISVDDLADSAEAVAHIIRNSASLRVDGGRILPRTP